MGGQFNLFSMFSQQDEKKIVEPDITDEEDNDDSDEDTSTTTTATVKTTKKKSSSTSSKKIDGPVLVVGNMWNFSYGEEGKKYTPAEVIKGVYDAGYTEVCCANITEGTEPNMLVATTLNKIPSSDDIAMGKKITIAIGGIKVEYEPSNFDGLEEEEIALSDVIEKFTQAYPQYKGCGLYLNSGAGIAVPCFTTDKAVKPDAIKGKVKFWNGTSIEEKDATEIADLYAIDGTTNLMYKSDDGIYHMAYAGKKHVVITDKELGISAGKSNKAKELYHLPFTLYLETYGLKIECKSEDFGGKATLTKEEIIEAIKPKYRLYGSPNRTVDVLYDKANALVSLAVTSGKKGAYASAIGSFSLPKFMVLPLGIFRGKEDVDTMEISDITFDMKLPKIPFEMLETIVEYFKSDISKEAIVQVYYSMKKGEYYLQIPEAKVSKWSVDYKMSHNDDILAITIHSHNTMAAIFSLTDDEDEIYTGLFGVIGRLDRPIPDMSFRVGFEGSFKSLSISDIFAEREVA